MNSTLSVLSELLKLVVSFSLQALVNFEPRDSLGSDDQVLVIFEYDLADLQIQVKLKVTKACCSIVLLECHVPLWGNLGAVLSLEELVCLDHRDALFEHV